LPYSQKSVITEPYPEPDKPSSPIHTSFVEIRYYCRHHHRLAPSTSRSQNWRLPYRFFD